MLYVFRAPFHPYPPPRDFLYRIDFQGIATIRWKFHFLIDSAAPSGGGPPRCPTAPSWNSSIQCQMCSYAGVATAEGAAPPAPAGRRGLLLLAAVSALTFAVSSTRPSTATAPLPRPSTTSALAVSATTPPPPPPAVAAGAGARAPRVVCLAANRTFAVGAMIDVPPLASSCRPCTCTPRGEWQCCTVRPAAHSIARGTERYAETLAFVAAWSHLKQES